MNTPACDKAAPGRLAELRPLLSELMDLKRIRTPDHPDGLAAHGFRRAWAALASGMEPRRVALQETARALAAVRLGGLDTDVLRRAGLSPLEVTRVLEQGLDAVATRLDPGLRERLCVALAQTPETAQHVPPPAFVERLVHQPRAGATFPGRPRLIVPPQESHADHCYAVAVMAVLVAPRFGASPALPFVAGLAHHLFNAALPDAGYGGEALLGDLLTPLMRRMTEQALTTLSEPLAGIVRQALALPHHADTAEARAFNAADVLDRVLELEAHAKAASFTLRQAMEDLELNHPGPLQAFGDGVLREAEVWP
jgi:5'-deoxynucleotidase YfbR-like HD superfamily hydrolase